MALTKATQVPDISVTSDIGYVGDRTTYVTPEQGFSSLQECYDYAMEHGLQVRLGPYTYEVTEPIVTSGSITTVGCGEEVTVLRQTAGLGVFSHTNNAKSDFFSLSGVSIVTTQAFASGNRAIVIDSRPLLSGTEVQGRNRAKGRIEKVSILGSDARADGISFGIGIDLISTGFMTLTDLQFIGSSSAATPYDFNGVHIMVRGDGKPVEIYLTRIRGYNAKYGYLCPEYSEGLRFHDVNFVNCNNGIVCSPVSEYVIGTLGQVGCYEYVVTGCHINASTIGIMLNVARYCAITDNFFIMDDHGVTSSVNPITLRSGSYNQLSDNRIVHFAVEGTTGLTRAGVVFDACSDSTCHNLMAKVEADTYEYLTHAVRFINASSRNRFTGLNVQRATTAISNASGCGNNQVADYTFLGVTTAVVDENGDLDRNQVDVASVTFNPAGAAYYDLVITPSRNFTRRPNGIALTQCAPLTVNLKLLYDFDNSTSTSVRVRVVPFTAGSLPTVNCRVSITMFD